MARRTVTVWLSGGLGNQLFQYATARRLALTSGAALVLDHASGFASDWYQAKFSLHAFAVAGRLVQRPAYATRIGRAKRRLARAINDRLPLGLRSYVHESAVSTPRDLLELRPHRDVYLEGGWMYETYFADIREQLLEELDVPGPHDAMNLEVAARIRDTTSAAVHIRRLRGQPNLSSSAPLPDDPSRHVSIDYYRRAIEHLVTRAGVDHLFVFADYPAWAREHLRPPVPMTIVDHNGIDRDYEDFWLMRQCKHFVLANSTFGWWAAWLGREPTKQVVVSAHYVTPERGLVSVPSRWTQLE